MTERRLDLRVLDPAAGGSLDALLSEINERAAPELARRATARGPIAVLAGWAKPALAAAAALAAVSLVGLSIARSAGSAAPLRGVPEELGLPSLVAEWVAEGRTPTRDDLLIAMDDDFR